MVLSDNHFLGSFTSCKLYLLNRFKGYVFSLIQLILIRFKFLFLIFCALYVSTIFFTKDVFIICSNGNIQSRQALCFYWL